MSRRSTRQQVFDEQALPGRVRLLVPEGGMRELPELHAWLAEQAPGRYAIHSACQPGSPDAVFLYLDDLRIAAEVLQRFCLRLAPSPRRLV